jgi:hypothetical protein
MKRRWQDNEFVKTSEAVYDTFANAVAGGRAADSDNCMRAS